MKVLVTGGAGFIGSHVVERLIARGDEVVVLDSLDPQVHGKDAETPKNLEPLLNDPRLRFLKGNVCDRDTLDQALGESEGVIHLAAAVGVGQSMYQPYQYVHTNGCGTALLLELLVGRRKHKVEKIVVASSMSLYGEGSYLCPACDSSTPRARTEEQLIAGQWEVRCAHCDRAMEPRATSESKPAEIASIYAATKKHQEDLVLSFAQAYGIPAFALRFFNVYGPRQSLGNPYTGVAAIFLSRLLNRKPPMVFEDGLQSRDFIYVDDIAEAVIRALDASHKGEHAINVGTGEPVTIAGVARAVGEALGVAIEPEHLGRYRAGDIRHCFADPTRAKELLGFEARWSFDDGVRQLIEWSRGAEAMDRVEESLRELESFQLVQ